MQEDGFSCIALLGSEALPDVGRLDERHVAHLRVPYLQSTEPSVASNPVGGGDMRLTSSDPPYSARYVSQSRRIRSSENSRSSRQFIHRKANWINCRFSSRRCACSFASMRATSFSQEFFNQVVFESSAAWRRRGRHQLFELEDHSLDAWLREGVVVVHRI